MCGAVDRAAKTPTIHGYHRFPLRATGRSSCEWESIQPIVLRYFRPCRHTPYFPEAASSAAVRRETQSSFVRGRPQVTQDSLLSLLRCQPNVALTRDGESRPPTPRDRDE